MYIFPFFFQIYQFLFYM
jgi:hypothetical protein